MGITHGWTSAASPDSSDVTPANFNDHTIANDTVTEAQLSISDNTTKNVSTAAHGLAPKGDGDTAKFLNANGAYSASTPLSVAGDMLFMDPNGTKLLSSQAGPFTTAGGGEYLGTRVTGLVTGHTIRVTWEAKRTGGGNNEQWLKGLNGGVTVLCSFKAADMTNTSYVSYSADLTLTGGATEIQYWTTVNAAEVRLLAYTDLTATVPARLAIGTEGKVLKVVSSLPQWATNTAPAPVAAGALISAYNNFR